MLFVHRLKDDFHIDELVELAKTQLDKSVVTETHAEAMHFFASENVFHGLMSLRTKFLFDYSENALLGLDLPLVGPRWLNLD